MNILTKLPNELKRKIDKYNYEENRVNIWKQEIPMKELLTYLSEEYFLENLINELEYHLPNSKKIGLCNKYLLKIKDREVPGHYFYDDDGVDPTQLIEEMVEIIKKEETQHKNYRQIYVLYINYIYLLNQITEGR